MKTIDVSEIKKSVCSLIEKASFSLGERELSALRKAHDAEDSGSVAKSIMSKLLENADIAEKEKRPLCQDTGVAVFFLEIGQDVHIDGGDLETSINEAVAESYTGLFLRKSILNHPVERKNTGNNTPAVIHTRIVPGENLRIVFDAKGGGCENMSKLAMLTPSAGIDGVKKFVVETVVNAGGNPCPPVVVGVGLGGTFEKAAILAKEALIRPLGYAAENESDAGLERELLSLINEKGSGPQGLGGKITALAVHVNSHPCHIASLPVAVNLDCHSHRHAEVVL